MSETKTNHSKWLHIRLKEEEHTKIHSKYSASTCRKLSEYARRVLLDKAITVNRRNQSLDDFMTEMIRLRHELNAIGNNFNQAVKKLHTMDHIEEVKQWLPVGEKYLGLLAEKMESVKTKIAQLSDQWLQ